VICLVILPFGGVGSAQDWPQFRGPHGGVAANHASLPDTWSETHNVVWKIDVPGRGWSSPIVWGDHVFVTTAVNLRQPRQRLLSPEAYRGASTGGTMSRRDLVTDTDEFRWTLYDVDAASGRVRWERTIHTAVPTRPVHMKNSYASETPVTDGKRVYVYLGYVGLFAYDMNGELAWARSMAARNTGNDGFFYGGGASPALHDGRLYIVNDNEEESFIAAFDATTGAELWRAVRDERSNWSTPFVAKRYSHRDRHCRLAQDSVLRPQWRAAVGACGRHDAAHPDAICAGRDPVRELWLLQRPSPAGLRHSARRGR
jgi:outer membrane protein assembly factor BamB